MENLYNTYLEHKYYIQNTIIKIMIEITKNYQLIDFTDFHGKIEDYNGVSIYFTPNPINIFDGYFKRTQKINKVEDVTFNYSENELIMTINGIRFVGITEQSALAIFHYMSKTENKKTTI